MKVHAAPRQAHAPLCSVLGSTVWISTRSLTSAATQVASAQTAGAATSFQASHLPSDTRGGASRAAEVCRAPQLHVAAGSAAQGAATQKAASRARRHMRCWQRRQAARPLPPPSPSPPHQKLPGRLWAARLSTTGYATEGFQLQASPAAPCPCQSSAATEQDFGAPSAAQLNSGHQVAVHGTRASNRPRNQQQTRVSPARYRTGTEACV